MAQEIPVNRSAMQETRGNEPAQTPEGESETPATRLERVVTGIQDATERLGTGASHFGESVKGHEE